MRKWTKELGEKTKSKKRFTLEMGARSLFLPKEGTEEKPMRKGEVLSNMGSKKI